MTASQLPPVLNGKVKVLVEDPDDTEEEDGKGGKKALKEVRLLKGLEYSMICDSLAPPRVGSRHDFLLLC